jgi:S1-C subfamily serine protease
MRKLLMIIGLAVVLGWPPISVNAGERENIVSSFARLSPSVGALYAQEDGGNFTFLCSATAIDRKGENQTVILTAQHCLRKGVSYLINFGDNRMRGITAWKVPHYVVDEEEYPRAFNQPLTDMALFLMDGTDVPVVPMAGTKKMKPGEKIITLGYPLGVTKINYEGIVSGYFNRKGSDLFDYIMLQIFGAPGSSGSAIINLATGEVVGVLVQAKQGYVGLPVIFATPANHVKYLIPVRTEKKNKYNQK